ncbi:hypothetical protein ACWD6R_21535 [Streptomyces sp. NPDC005151]
MKAVSGQPQEARDGFADIVVAIGAAGPIAALGWFFFGPRKARHHSH